jgi:hemerythrin superfamily protein
MTSAGSDIASGQDVVTFLVAQHNQVKQLFEDVMNATGDAREEAFAALRRMLAVHETAEEEIVHPRARQALEDGDDIVGARLQEENEAKQTLSELEKLDVSSAEFETMFRELQADVLMHASAEEQQEFGRLADVLDNDELERMRTAVRVAQSVAPTRPHPGVESPAANMLVGPFASMMDRARDLLTGKNKDA